jgi:hypothetical protein
MAAYGEIPMAAVMLDLGCGIGSTSLTEIVLPRRLILAWVGAGRRDLGSRVIERASRPRQARRAPGCVRG